MELRAQGLNGSNNTGTVFGVITLKPESLRGYQICTQLSYEEPDLQSKTQCPVSGSPSIAPASGTVAVGDIIETYNDTVDFDKLLNGWLWYTSKISHTGGARDHCGGAAAGFTFRDVVCSQYLTLDPGKCAITELHCQGPEIVSVCACPVLEVTMQNFSQEAKDVIAQHHQIINETKAKNTTVKVLRNKSPHSGKIIPLDIKKMEALDVVQEFQKANKNICFSKDLPVKEHSKDMPQITFKKPHIFNVNEACKTTEDLILKENIKLSKIMNDIDSVSKKMEKEKKLQSRKNRVQKVLNRTDKYDNKVKRIGPHIEIFQLFRKKQKMKMDKKNIKKVTIVQAIIRGWLERRRMQRVMAKALDHAQNLKEVIDMYSAQIFRIKYRLGIWRTRQILTLSELEEWMDRKKYYETIFAKKQDWQGLDKSELPKFFNECGHFPTLQNINSVWHVVHKEYRDKYTEVIKKNVAIEMLFTLYPPKGAHVKGNEKFRSTWLRPIVDGEEGYKYIVANHPVLKKADIRIVGKLVARSIRERKIRQHRLL
ncbi:IQ domain-containing protein M [Suncus etruscus]|uniref:IQ domain-containing protein M n=1 Tax=Suncus etruscus TaxID=109475 RepID=UPI002110399F|nr:IQ domain-containing protein M [Suncus etruscus]